MKECRDRRKSSFMFRVWSFGLPFLRKPLFWRRAHATNKVPGPPQTSNAFDLERSVWKTSISYESLESKLWQPGCLMEIAIPVLLLSVDR